MDVPAHSCNQSRPVLSENKLLTWLIKFRIGGGLSIVKLWTCEFVSRSLMKKHEGL